MVAIVEGPRVRIRFAYDPVMVGRVKQLAGRQWEPNSKTWTCSTLPENIVALAGMGFEVVGYQEPEPTPEYAPGEEPWLEVPFRTDQKTGLRSYQVSGIQFVIHGSGRRGIGDEMGTGKTIQALGFLRYAPENLPALVVCTATTKGQWKREWAKWLPGRRYEVLYGQKPRKLKPGRSFIINWDILHYWRHELLKVGLRTVIADECQAMATPGANRSRAARRLAKRVNNFIPMSGTPIRSRPSQFWSVLNCLNEMEFPDKDAFIQRYAVREFNGYGWTELPGVKNGKELHEKVAKYFIRREKKDVLADLPEKSRAVVPIPAKISKEFRDVERFVYDGLDAGSRDMFLQMQQLSRTAFPLMREGIVQWIEDFRESGQSVVVYTYHRTVTQYLLSAFEDAQHIDGGVRGSHREERLEWFKEGSGKMLIAQILSVGTGVDGLQDVCSNAIFVELSTNPTDHLQAEDRLHRSGQHDPVNIYYLLAEDTIQELMMEALDIQLKAFDTVVRGEETAPEDMLASMKRINKERNET